MQTGLDAMLLAKEICLGLLSDTRCFCNVEELNALSGHAVTDKGTSWNA